MLSVADEPFLEQDVRKEELWHVAKYLTSSRSVLLYLELDQTPNTHSLSLFLSFFLPFFLSFSLSLYLSLRSRVLCNANSHETSAQLS